MYNVIKPDFYEFMSFMNQHLPLAKQKDTHIFGYTKYFFEITDGFEVKVDASILNLKLDNNFAKLVYNYFNFDFKEVVSIIESYHKHFTDYGLIDNKNLNEILNNCFLTEDERIFFSDINLYSYNTRCVTFNNLIVEVQVTHDACKEMKIRTVIYFPVMDISYISVTVDKTISQPPIVKVSKVLKSQSIKRTRNAHSIISNYSSIDTYMENIAFSRAKNIINLRLGINKRIIKKDPLVVQDYFKLCEMINI